MMENLRAFGWLVLGVGLMTGCQSPVHIDSRGKAGTVTILFGTAGRTVVADWADQVSSYQVTLSGHSGEAPDQSTTVSGTSATFANVEAGTWTVTVTAFNPSNLAIGTGTASMIVSTSSAAAQVVLAGIQNDVGGFSLALAVPTSTGIDTVSAQLMDDKSQQVGETMTTSLDNEGSVMLGSVAQNGIPSGAYWLRLTFTRGQTVAGIFYEAVNVWDNVISDQWLGSDGQLYDLRTFEAVEFNSPLANLASLVLKDGSGATLSLSPGFSSSTTEYQVYGLGLAQGTATVTATLASDGQGLAYRVGEGAWTLLGSGHPSSAVSVETGQPIRVRVTAPDQVTTQTYVVSFSFGTVGYNANGADSGTVPVDSAQYRTGDSVTVAANPGELARSGFTFSGWNTLPDGTGTSYAAGNTLPMGTSNLTLYAVWAEESSLIISGTTLTGGTIPANGVLIVPPGVTSIGADSFYQAAGLVSVVLPSSVTSIDNQAFRECASLTSVSLSSTLISIGESVFVGCTGLTSITIPPTVTSIGRWAFMGTGLTSIVIPPSVTTISNDVFNGCTGLTSVSLPSTITAIGYQAFYECTGLTSLSLPAAITSIGSGAFYGCSGLTSLTLPAGLTTIESSAFGGCTGLTTLTLPAGITSIGASAFYGCSGLTGLTLPAGLTSLGAYAFYGCSGLTSLTLPAGITSLGQFTFYGCTGLTSLTLPANLTFIGGHALRGCTGLTSLTLPAGLTSIDLYAFYGCTGLTSITIPAPVTSIASSVFEGCSNLLTIVCNPITPPTITASTFTNTPGTLEFRVPGTSVSVYQAATNWSAYSSRIVSQ